MPDVVAPYMRAYAAGMASAAGADTHEITRERRLWQACATEALKHFRRAAKLCDDAEAKAMILAQAAKWARALNQPKLARKLLDDAIKLAGEGPTADRLRELRQALVEGPRRVVLPRGPILSHETWKKLEDGVRRG